MATDQKNPNRALLDKADWGDLHARLLAFATHRTRKQKHLARDAVQAAITSVFAYESKWDPAKEPDLLRYLMSVVNSQLANHATSASTTRTSSLTAKSTRDAAHAVSDPQAFSPENAADYDLVSRRLALLAERLAGDPEALHLLHLKVEGTDTPADIRAATRWSDPVMDAARRRMMRAAARVAREIGPPADDDALTLTLAGDDDDDERASDSEDDDEEEVA